MKSPDAEHIKKLMEFWQGLEKISKEDDDAWDLAFELEYFLVRSWFTPGNIGDIRTLPATLHQEAILFLIERDASTAYDQIDGFCDTVIMQELAPEIVAGCQPTDGGLQICEWISNNIPEEKQA